MFAEGLGFKHIRKQLVGWAERIIRKTGMSDEFICGTLRFFHFIIPVITVILLFVSTQKIFMIVVLFNIIVFILFFLFDGCILSRLEHCFTDDSFTVIDPFLMIIGVELTNENRTRYSIYSSLLGFAVTYGIYQLRFGKSISTNMNMNMNSISNSMTGGKYIPDHDMKTSM
jgi:hypothetical protein